MNDLNDLSSHELGRRIKVARESANMRQEEAAKLINVSRPTLVSLEKGARRVRIREIQTLAKHYGVSVNRLLRPEAVHIDLVPRFRKLTQTEDKFTLEAVNVLAVQVKAEVELEDILGITRSTKYPPEQSVESGNVLELAEEHAQLLRNWLGLGPGPIANIFSLIEIELGIRLHQRRLSSGSKVSGLFTYDPSVGACILLNANHPVERRTQTAAHELGHFIGTRQVADVSEIDEKLNSRDEKYANAFARAFLTPKREFELSFNQVIAGSDRLTRRHVILLSNQYNISREACVRRLESLGIVKKGTWDWFESNGGITNKQANEVLGINQKQADTAYLDSKRLVSHRISTMAHAVWKRELLSEGQLADLLEISRLDLRRVLDEIEVDESETSDFLSFSNT